MTRAIHLFAGPGGLELGAEAVGVSGVGIEWDANAVATRVAAGLATVHGDVRRYGPADFPDATVLTAGPPCQTYTVAGSGAGRQAMADVLGAVKAMGARTAVDSGLLGDERTGLVLEPLRWILAALDSGRPYTAVVLEQVQQVQQVQQVWNAYAEVLRVEGYSVATGVLRTEQFGVPQTRRRAVLVARLDGPVALPEPSRRSRTGRRTVTDDMRREIILREINQGALAGMQSQISEQAADLILAALDRYDSWAAGRLQARLDRIAEAHSKHVTDGGLTDGACIECGHPHQCPTRVWATTDRDPLATWDPADSEEALS